MADTKTNTPIRVVWIKLVNNVGLLLVPQPDDRHLDQFLDFRDAVLPLVQDEGFLGHLETKFKEIEGPENGNALIEELKAISRGIEVTTATEKTKEKQQGEGASWWSKLLGRASIGVGSVKDIIKLEPKFQHALTLFKELIDLFKGKD